MCWDVVLFQTLERIFLKKNTQIGKEQNKEFMFA
jgi:hypothetical protein